MAEFTKEEKRKAIIEWLSIKTGWNLTEDTLEGGFRLVVEAMVNDDLVKYHRTSEKMDDMAITYGGDGGLPPYITEFLENHTKRSVGSLYNKRKYGV